MLRFLDNTRLNSLNPDPKFFLYTRFLQHPHFKPLSTTSQPSYPISFTRDYLINSCGLSPQRAQSVAQKLPLKSTDNPNLVLNFFHNHGFSKTQITTIISSNPKVIRSNPEKTLKPKFDFLQHLGVSPPNLADMVSARPTILNRALKTQLIPSVKYLRSFVGTDDNVCAMVKRHPLLLEFNLEKIMGPNIKLLRNVGVPGLNISKMLLMKYPNVLRSKTDQFRVTVDEVREMGFNPKSTMFLHALRSKVQLSDASWERKLRVYEEFGWSKDDILAMFRKQPVCMNSSECKIRRAMDFFTRVLKWEPCDISSNSVLLGLNMDKRILRRCAVLGVLYSAGVLEQPPVKTALTVNEKKFVEKYVTEYREIVPDVVKAYEGKIGFSGFEKVSVSKEL